jgi:hypothetical protein
MLLIANLLVLSVACGQINGLSSRKVMQSLVKCSFARATIKYFGLIERPAELPPCSLSKLLCRGQYPTPVRQAPIQRPPTPASPKSRRAPTLRPSSLGGARLPFRKDLVGLPPPNPSLFTAMPEVVEEPPAGVHYLQETPSLRAARSSAGAVASINSCLRSLGVRYVLEGAVQRDQSRVRSTPSSSTPKTGAHLWADRFDEDLADLFKLQDDAYARFSIPSEMFAVRWPRASAPTGRSAMSGFSVPTTCRFEIDPKCERFFAFCLGYTKAPLQTV